MPRPQLAEHGPRDRIFHLAGQGSGLQASRCSGRGSPWHWVSGRTSSSSCSPWARAQYSSLCANPPPQLTLHAASLYLHLKHTGVGGNPGAGPPLLSADWEGSGDVLSLRGTLASPPRGWAQWRENIPKGPLPRQNAEDKLVQRAVGGETEHPRGTAKPAVSLIGMLAPHRPAGTPDLLCRCVCHTTPMPTANCVSGSVCSSISPPPQASAPGGPELTAHCRVPTVRTAPGRGGRRLGKSKG